MALLPPGNSSSGFQPHTVPPGYTLPGSRPGYPTTPAPPSPPGGGGGGGAGLDWQTLLNNNPYYLAAQALAAQQLAALKAQTGSSAARALVNLGDYSLAAKVHGLTLPGGTEALVDQGNKSGTSVLSQLLHAHTLNEQRIPAQLAGRGFYRSGETGYSLGEENRQYGNKGYQARQQTLDYLNNLYDNYVNAQFGIQQNQLGAYFQAYQQAMAQIAAGGYGSGGGASGGASDTGLRPNADAPYGYNAAGQPVDLSAAYNAFPYNPDSSKPWTSSG